MDEKKKKEKKTFAMVCLSGLFEDKAKEVQEETLFFCRIYVQVKKEEEFAEVESYLFYFAVSISILFLIYIGKSCPMVYGTSIKEAPSNPGAAP